MKRDKEETKVIFKMARYNDGERELIAFFPGATANRGCIMCYTHIGQHEEASEEFYATRCASATPKQYAPLKKELECLCGYRLRVVKRISRKDRDQAWRWSTPEGERVLIELQKKHAIAK
jgi:hypothetical protein